MLEIVKLPTKSLRERSEEIDREFLLSDQIQKLLQDMIPAMYKAEGIGLAAPQIGRNIRACIIGKDSDKSLETDLILINPTFEKLSRKSDVESEGCLSVPYTFGKVKRLHKIHVKALSNTGEELDFEAKGFFARVIQHEVDHLNGMLFIDRAKGIYEVDPEKKVKHAAELREERGI